MEKIKILFLAANPTITSQLRLDEEVRAITQKIRASEYRDSLTLISCWAVRADDLIQLLNEHKPHIVHFSDHGSRAGEIILVDDDGRPHAVSVPAIKALFRTMKDNVRLVVLNACFSYSQACAITEVIDCAVGMSMAISDRAATIFAASLYRAIGFGRSIQEAFEQAVAALLLEGVDEDSTPKLLQRDGIDPLQVRLLVGALSDTQVSRKGTAVDACYSGERLETDAWDQPDRSGRQAAQAPQVPKAEAHLTRSESYKAFLDVLNSAIDSIDIISFWNLGAADPTRHLFFDALRDAVENRHVSHQRIVWNKDHLLWLEQMLQMGWDDLPEFSAKFYHVNPAEAPLTTFDLIDQKVVFFGQGWLIEGHVEIRSDTVGQYFRGYFASMWNKGEWLKERGKAADKKRLAELIEELS